MAVEKNTERMSFYGSKPLELDLRRLAEKDNRTFSDYLRVVLEAHAWGHCAPSDENGTGLNRADSAQSRESDPE